MRFSTIMVVTMLIVLLATAAGCTSSTPKGGSITTPAETTLQPAAAISTAVPASTAAPVTTTSKCPSGQTSCSDGTCRDTTSDHDACGGCGNVCPAGYLCKASDCVNPAATAAVTEIVTQPITSPTTSIPVNPATTTVPTTTPTLQGASRYSGSVIGNNFQQGITVMETTYPPGTTNVDCSKHPISITSISPSSGPKSGGTMVVIRGSGFKRGSYLLVEGKFGTGSGVSPESGASDTEMIVKTPPTNSAGTVNVQVSAVLSWQSNKCLSPVTPAAKFTYT